jgi:hypothetical protein
VNPFAYVSVSNETGVFQDEMKGAFGCIMSEAATISHAEFSLFKELNDSQPRLL